MTDHINGAFEKYFKQVRGIDFTPGDQMYDREKGFYVNGWLDHEKLQAEKCCETCVMYVKSSYFCDEFGHSDYEPSHYCSKWQKRED